MHDVRLLQDAAARASKMSGDNPLDVIPLLAVAVLPLLSLLGHLIPTFLPELAKQTQQLLPTWCAPPPPEPKKGLWIGRAAVRRVAAQISVSGYLLHKATDANYQKQVALQGHFGPSSSAAASSAEPELQRLPTIG